MGMLLSVRGIRKSFGAVAALRHADLDMAEGEVVALLGDNGAGKSTFVRLLSGAGRPDGGTFRFGGNPVDLAKYSVRKARDMGIETVHQDRCLCEGQSLWRNMFVGRHVRTRWGFIDIAAEREATRVMLRDKGRSVLLVSHHVHQAYDVADRFLFMDKGRTVGEVRREGTSPADLTERLLSLAEGRGA